MPSLWKNSGGTIQPIVGYEGRRVHTFFKVNSLKVKVIFRLDNELAYYNIAIQHVSQNVTESPLY